MKIAITGGSGSLGRNLAALPHEIINLNRKKLGDFHEVKDWKKHFEGFEAVIHLAAKTPDSSKNVSAQDYDDDAALAGNIARGAAAAGVKTFVFLSSASVYGRGRPAAFAEHETAPESLYGQSKLMAEKLALHNSGTMRAVIIRAPMIYGPGFGENFMKLAKISGFPLPLGSVLNARSFLSAANFRDFVGFALDNPTMHGIYNVTDGVAISTPGLIRRLAAAQGKRAMLFPFPPGILKTLAEITGKRRISDSLMESFRLDDTNARGAGWRAPYSLDQGIQEALYSSRS